MQEGEEMTTGTHIHEILKELFVRKSELSLGSHKGKPPKRTVQLVKVHILNHKLIKFAKTNELNKFQKALRK